MSLASSSAVDVLKKSAEYLKKFLGFCYQWAIYLKLDRAIFTCCAVALAFGSTFYSTKSSLENAPYIYRNIKDYAIKCQKISSDRVYMKGRLDKYVGKNISVKNSVCYIFYTREDQEYLYTRMTSFFRGKL